MHIRQVWAICAANCRKAWPTVSTQGILALQLFIFHIFLECPSSFGYWEMYSKAISCQFDLTLSTCCPTVMLWQSKAVSVTAHKKVVLVFSVMVWQHALPLCNLSSVALNDAVPSNKPSKKKNYDLPSNVFWHVPMKNVIVFLASC